LSDRVREVSGIEAADVRADDFARLVQLVRLCPERGDDQADIRSVGLYYGFLRAIKYISAFTAPRLAAWTDHERQSCSHFAAVALDRRICYSRDLFTQQVAGRT